MLLNIKMHIQLEKLLRQAPLTFCGKHDIHSNSDLISILNNKIRSLGKIDFAKLKFFIFFIL